MDLKKLIEPFEQSDKAKLFSEKFVEGFTNPAFGTLSKAEVDNLVFALLIKVDALNPKSQAYEIARDLNVTPAKARNLLFQWQLRNMGDGPALKEDLVAALKTVRFTKEGDLLAFGIESPLLREELRSSLKRMGIFADASFSSEIVRLPVKHFVEFLDNILDQKVKQEMYQALIKDNLLKDTSFKAISFRILKGIAMKAVGEVGEDLADQFGMAVQGLAFGNIEAVKDAIEGIDLNDEKLNYA